MEGGVFMDKNFLLTYEYPSCQTGSIYEGFEWFETEEEMNEYIDSEGCEDDWVVIEKFEIISAREIE